MTALWCLFGYCLVCNPAFGQWLRVAAWKFLPAFLIVLGLLVMDRAGTFSLLLPSA